MSHKLTGIKRRAKREGWLQWIRSEQDERAALGGCYFDPELAERPVSFFRDFLRHTKGAWAGQPFELLPWQRDQFIMPLYGWQRLGGVRRFRECYVEVPKKNGKSTLCAGLELFGLLEEPGAEVYTAAVDRSQAGIVHGEAANMVRNSPALSDLLEITDSTKTIRLGTSAWIRALSADVPTKEGLNIHYLVTDELHAWKDRRLFDTLTYGTAARRQPLKITITTAGADTTSVCFEKHQYAEKVIAGTVEDASFFGLIYAADPKDDWQKERTWKKANPSYGVSIQHDEMSEAIRQVAGSAQAQANFKRYRLNVWTTADQPWIAMDHWEACKAGIEETELIGARCWSGLDLASVQDIAALVHVFPDDSDGCFDVVCRFWCPEVKAREVTEKGIAPYADWIRAGYLTATPGEVIDYDFIMAQIQADAEQFDIQSLCFDRWGSTQLVQKLDEAGMVVIPFGQGFKSMSPPTKELDKLIRQHRLRHHNPVLDWMAGNAVVKEDPAGAIKLVKNATGGRHKKIDGIVALVMALDRAILQQETTASYDGDGALMAM